MRPEGQKKESPILLWNGLSDFSISGVNNPVSPAPSGGFGMKMQMGVRTRHDRRGRIRFLQKDQVSFFSSGHDEGNYPWKSVLVKKGLISGDSIPCAFGRYRPVTWFHWLDRIQMDWEIVCLPPQNGRCGRNQVPGSYPVRGFG